jgi:polysaccharide biosynthesis protein PslA
VAPKSDLATIKSISSAASQRLPRQGAEASPSAEIFRFPESASLANDIKAALQRQGSIIVCKRVLDIVIASAALILLAPLLLLIAGLIRLTSQGPAVFRQRRTGLNGVEFTIYKFRTMYAELQDVSGVKHTVKDDPRVTPIGRILRKLSIDELPQLLNVISGDMALVGPRAHAVGMLALGVPYNQFVRDYDLRHLVKPGLTGQAQIKGFRGEIDDEAHARGRIAEDLDYIKNLSILRDVWIMVLTLPAVISGRAAL